MSVLIKDMDIPHNCVMCPLCVEDYDLRSLCKLTGKYIGNFNKKERHPECPLMHTDSVYEVAYTAGANEAWRCADHVCTKLTEDEIFALFKVWNWYSVLGEFSASDAMRIIHEHEAEKERNAPHIGDEFESTVGVRIIIFAIDSNKYTCWTSLGEMIEVAKQDIVYWRKTGATYPEVSNLLTSLYNVSIQKGEKI